MAARPTSGQRKKPTQKPYKQYGFRSDAAYRAWLKNHSKLSPSDPLYFKNTSRGRNRAAEIARIQKLSKLNRSRAKGWPGKAKALVNSDKMSPFNFLDRYLPQMQAMLNDPNVTATQKRQLRKLIRDLESQVGEINDEKIPGEQLELFR